MKFLHFISFLFLCVRFRETTTKKPRKNGNDLVSYIRVLERLTQESVRPARPAHTTRHTSHILLHHVTARTGHLHY